MKFTIVILYILIHSAIVCDGLAEKQTMYYREMAKRMFYHAYDGYMKYAFPYDELRPITCDGHDTWGSYSLTLIDALDTLAIMGNSSEFRKVAQIVLDRANFGSDINVSVFETNIRIVGGLVSAHLMARRMGMELEPGWPCTGPLLRLAETVAKKLLPAFHTKTGMPYGTVNLAHGVPFGETAVTCTAGVGTYLVEFGALSRLTGDPIYEKAALRAHLAAWRQRSSLDLLGNHIDVTTGRWTALDAGIGAGVDSYFEYLVKGAALLQRPELMQIFNSARLAIDRHLRHDDWHLWVTMTRGHVTMPVFQSLEAFWPGVLTLAGDVGAAQKTLFNYHQVWRQYGFTPESYNIPQGEAGSKREGYPLRPELIESLMYMFRATADRTYLALGADIITSIEHSTKTACGYATVKNVKNHQLENRMESFFLAETTKYLYLLFAEDHWMHNNGARGTVWRSAKRRCILDAGGYIFNSEAHPIDPGALSCCSPSPAEGEGWMGRSAEQLAELILSPDGGALNTGNDAGTSDGTKHKLPRKLPEQYETGENALKNATAPTQEQILAKNVQHETKANADERSSDLVSEEKDKSVSANIEILTGIHKDLELTKKKIIDAVSKINNMSKGVSKRDLDTKETTKEQLVTDFENTKTKFEATYESKELKNDDDSLDKILTSTKTQFSGDAKELEPDSNLTTPDQTLNLNTEAKTSDGGGSSTTLNLPRFGAIIASSSENTSSERGETSSTENAGIATSVSSSKYSNPAATSGENLLGAKIIRDLLQPILEKNPRSIVPSGPSLREQLDKDLSEYSNFTNSASYSLLSCPHPSYANLLSYKGQIIEV
uniref:alpha-1,2-Mannosidase n=1 Tax=Hirondellea gigas TaxID=1518452 RepID=A0A2P2I5Z2_9CRUS